MLIILPEPSPSPELDVLAVNLNSYDTIGIRRLHSCFQLVVHKYFDAKFALDSAIFFVLVNLESREKCTAIGNSDHLLNQDCASLPSLKRKLCLRHSAVKVPKQNCVGNPTTSGKINSPSGQFITQVYHQKRPHSALGYLTPVEFQQQNLA